MSLFKRQSAVENTNRASLADVALNVIHDGVIIVDASGMIQFVNPAAAAMLNLASVNDAIGINYSALIRIEAKDGQPIDPENNLLTIAVRSGQILESLVVNLIAVNVDKRIPVSISVYTTGQNRIMTIRNVAKELEEEGAQMEFISTASHEMRTPVASIEGYLSLALNPQTATIDERAKGYLEAAHTASKHLGNLFRDLLDVTKLEDGRIKPNMVPVEMMEFIKQISDMYIGRCNEAKLKYSFGVDSGSGIKTLSQVVYGFVDTGFMREVMGNLIENAIKYTPEGGSVWVSVRGDGDRILINVTDTGIGVSADDLQHIFQKFYRADNSQTRTVGGTGLGLYLVKQRVEAMGGGVWAESAFGEGTTFYVSLPRLTADEYEKRMIVYRNQQAVQAFQSANVTQSQINNMKGQQ